MLPEYVPGARNAVRVCLGIGPGDRVAIVRDAERAAIAGALQEEAESSGAEVRSWLMEDLGPRPLTAFPRSLGEDLLRYRPTASFYVGGRMPGELAFRQPLLRLLTHELKARHGHMVGITHQVMVEGMAGDYEAVYGVTRKVYEAVRQASSIRVASGSGTELTAAFSKDRRWIPSDGRYHEQGRWGNLPEGEVFTAPLSVDGILAGQEIGDYFDERYGVLDPPARIRVKDSRAVAVEVPGRPEVERDFESYLGRHPCSNRVGEFAIGTNLRLSRIIGNFLQDEKFPGVHVAFGDPYAEETGADWECPSHADVLTTGTDVEVDGRKIMERGRFLI